MQSDCNDAVRLHSVPDDVNGQSAVPDLRAARVAATEERIVGAASRLFLADGYAATTLAQVAAAAGVGERTVYVRFGTKAALLKRVVDVAVVGDLEPVALAGRPAFQLALTAPTLAERITHLAATSRGIMERAGDLLAVAFDAEPTEPLLREASQAARIATRDSIRAFWLRAAEDGLLPAGADVEWLGDTLTLLGSAETYRLMRRALGYDPERYERWYATTARRLAQVAARDERGTGR
jgi:AcrR family transcriptional regulator